MPSSAPSGRPTTSGSAANSQCLLVNLDEDAEVYVIGVLAASEAGFVNSYEPMDISATAMKLLQPGATITLAVKCHQTEGGQGVDVGLINATTSGAGR
jgi:hypothetical protein